MNAPFLKPITTRNTPVLLRFAQPFQNVGTVHKDNASAHLLAPAQKLNDP